MNGHAGALVALGVLVAGSGFVTGGGDGATRQQVPQTAAVPVDAAAAARHEQAEVVRKSIAGREGEPATAVFSNVKVLVSSISAAQLVNAMEMTFGRSLAVKCDYCHDTADFASDALRTKRVAREMMRITGNLNVQFSQVTDFEKRTVVSCWTCHRGSAHPPQVPPTT